jgi:tetratricopeptide (TPR) repeat protein
MNKRALWIGLLGGLLTALTLLNACTFSPATAPGRPAGWSPLPTRAPAPILSLEEALARTRTALLRNDIDGAQEAWQQASTLAPTNTVVLREGARVALAAGDLEKAENRAWQAVQASPKEPTTWALLGVIWQRKGDSEPSREALAMAQSLNPELAPDLFSTRWVNARRLGDKAAMEELAREYALANPDGALTAYFRAEALLVDNDARSALDLLLLNTKAESPAVLWFTLGRAYLRLYGWQNTLTAMEVAGGRFSRGDASLYLASDAPARDINLAQAQAYLGLSRCTDAEPILRKLSTPQPELHPLWLQAFNCLTPSPTWTPWLPSDRGAAPPGSQDVQP